MRRVGLALAVLLYAPAPAAADEVARLPTCSDRADVLTNWEPTRVHAGAPFDHWIENHARVREDVADIAIETPSGVTSADKALLTEWTRIRLTAPNELGPFRIAVTWTQAAGARLTGAPACAGHDEFTIVAVPRSTRLGDTTEPRVDGRWRVAAHPLGHSGAPGRWVWRTAPSCDYGACTFRAGRRTWVARDEATRYELARFTVRDAGECTVRKRNALTGDVISTNRIRAAFSATISGKIRATSWELRGRDMVATRLEGKLVERITATPRARAAGCTGEVREYRLAASRT